VNIFVTSSLFCNYPIPTFRPYSPEKSTPILLYKVAPEIQDLKNNTTETPDSQIRHLRTQVKRIKKKVAPRHTTVPQLCSSQPPKSTYIHTRKREKGKRNKKLRKTVRRVKRTPNILQIFPPNLSNRKKNTRLYWLRNMRFDRNTGLLVPPVGSMMYSIQKFPSLLKFVIIFLYVLT
jgi:hypothetical protein